MKVLYLLLTLTCLIVPHSQAAINDEDCEKSADSSSAKPSKGDGIADKLGVDDFLVRVSGGGYMLDIRYRVVNADKAKQTFFKGKFQPFIIQESTGSRFTVPSSAKVGFMRQKPKKIQNDRMYFMILGNPGKTIQPGETVTLEIGDLKIPGLMVH